MAVLDTSALLHWPIERCRGQVVSTLQQTELSRVDEQRWMLIETLDMDWRTASKDERQIVLDIAAKTGDLPRLRMLISICLRSLLQTKPVLSPTTIG